MKIGEIFIFFISCVWALLTKHFYFKQFARQFTLIGYNSIPVVALTAIFTGAVLAVQSYTGFTKLFNPENTIASIVSLSVIRELGPVITGLMLAGRVGAAMTAEIGTMKISYQLDALSTMNVNSYAYLFAPKILSILVAMPLLVVIADIIGIYGSYLVVCYKLSLNDSLYISKVMHCMKQKDWIIGLIKVIVFGIIIAVISCYCGVKSEGGAFGIARSTTNAVVGSSILILFANYIITILFFDRP